jgi:hypothetical protein
MKRIFGQTLDFKTILERRYQGRNPYSKKVLPWELFVTVGHRSRNRIRILRVWGSNESLKD